MPRRRASTHELRSAIDCLPRPTREAMLAGVAANDIIVGAYVDRRGGICPMLAAHRHGSRIDFLPFSRAWDRFTQAKRARRATQRELRVLTAHLQSSLLADEAADVDFRGAIVEHRALRARTAAERAMPAPRLGRRPRRADVAEGPPAAPRPALRTGPSDAGGRPRPGDANRAAELRDLRDRADLPRANQPGDPNRTAELRDRPGWSWLRPFGRVEELDRAVAAAAVAVAQGPGGGDPAERDPAGLV